VVKEKASDSTPRKAEPGAANKVTNEKGS